jgi:hypothetical protein
MIAIIIIRNSGSSSSAIMLIVAGHSPHCSILRHFVQRRRIEHLSHVDVVPTGNNIHHLPHTSRVTRHTLHVTRHTSHVARHTSHVTRRTVIMQVLSATRIILLILAKGLDPVKASLQAARHTSHVTRHTTNVTRHTSHVTRHTSHVTRHTSPLPDRHEKSPRWRQKNSWSKSYSNTRFQ